jgi:hypothetical protein
MRWRWRVALCLLSLFFEKKKTRCAVSTVFQAWMPWVLTGLYVGLISFLHLIYNSFRIVSHRDPRSYLHPPPVRCANRPWLYRSATLPPSLIPWHQPG